jgi:hypothetical protein
LATLLHILNIANFVIEILRILPKYFNRILFLSIFSLSFYGGGCGNQVDTKAGRTTISKRNDFF